MWHANTWEQPVVLAADYQADILIPPSAKYIIQLKLCHEKFNVYKNYKHVLTGRDATIVVS